MVDPTIVNTMPCGDHSRFWSIPSTKAQDGIGQNLIILFYLLFSDHSEHNLERLSPKGIILLSFYAYTWRGSPRKMGNP